ncbi:hypothetical protein LDO32_08980 [Luteimonas sp. Y-2-2-4F]|nr:hypothetical protein [Luteimonas sp. Y-2-2-4F]MCD9031573.1 hypothetical protein [Luteimonas sp. Y-2-2-4F]MCD9031852.1 hypothetical protein [Luteimonas sp. Y-2-2-4F]
MQWSKAAVAACAGLLLQPLALAQGGETDPAAERAFARAQSLCRADEGRLWGVDLCGPMMVADPATRRFVASADGAEDPLRADGALFRGELPDSVPIANTALDWNGRRWTMLMAPLPAAEPALSVLLMHESWHRVQGEIGLPAVNADQDHLDTEDGRLWLRLELRALAAALGAEDREASEAAVRDALSFRAWRRARFPGAAEAEDAMERHEGVAEYTGRVLSQDPDMLAHLAQDLRKADAVGEYARSFAYYTGPAYGVLLDRDAPGWRDGWDRRAGLAQLLAPAIGWTGGPDEAAAEAAGARYGIADVRGEETARASERRRLVAALRAKLVDGPVLLAPVQGASFSFDPNRVTPLPPEGAVYGTIRVGADWGVLEVADGGLLSKDWRSLSVACDEVSPTPDGFRGAGWVLKLEPGWQLVEAGRSGDRTIRRAP